MKWKLGAVFLCLVAAVVIWLGTRSETYIDQPDIDFPELRAQHGTQGFIIPRTPTMYMFGYTNDPGLYLDYDWVAQAVGPIGSTSAGVRITIHREDGEAPSVAIRPSFDPSLGDENYQDPIRMRLREIASRWQQLRYPDFIDDFDLSIVISRLRNSVDVDFHSISQDQPGDPSTSCYALPEGPGMLSVLAPIIGDPNAVNWYDRSTEIVRSHYERMREEFKDRNRDNCR